MSDLGARGSRSKLSTNPDENRGYVSGVGDVFLLRWHLVTSSPVLGLFAGFEPRQPGGQAGDLLFLTRDLGILLVDDFV